MRLFYELNIIICGLCFDTNNKRYDEDIIGMLFKISIIKYLNIVLLNVKEIKTVLDISKNMNYKYRKSRRTFLLYRCRFCNF